MATATNRSTGRSVPGPGDVTALQKQALEEKAAAAKAEEARKLAAQAEVESYEAKNVVIDYSGADVPLPEVIVDESAQDNPYREITIKYTIDQMAFGREIVQAAEFDDRGNILVPPRLGGIRYFSFKEGRRYNVPRALAEHLDERGYVFH